MTFTDQTKRKFRGKPVDEVVPAAMLRAYRERRRENDLFTEVS